MECALDWKKDKDHELGIFDAGRRDSLPSIQ